MESNNKYTIGIYEDEDVVLSAVKKLRDAGIKIDDVYSPYPVHGMEHAMGYKRSKLPVAAFLFGMTGTFLALLMQGYMMAVDWPMIIGGKDYASVTFVPVTFELTVLLSAFGMVGTFLVVSNLKPWGKTKSPDIRSTDDKHVMVIAEEGQDVNHIHSLLKETGASEINQKEIDNE